MRAIGGLAQDGTWCETQTLLQSKIGATINYSEHHDENNIQTEETYLPTYFIKNHHVKKHPSIVYSS